MVHPFEIVRNPVLILESKGERTQFSNGVELLWRECVEIKSFLSKPHHAHLKFGDSGLVLFFLKGFGVGIDSVEGF